MMARHWGMLRGQDFSGLGERERDMMGNYGIGDAEWKLLNTVEWHDLDGIHLTPDVVDRISDADMAAYLKARGIRNELVSGGEGRPVVEAPWSPEALQNARDDLGLSIYGDFLLGEWSRFGRGLVDTAVGPTLGQLDTVAELWTDLTHPSKWKSGAPGVATKFTRENLPFVNLIYTKLAFDHAIYYRLMEYLSPGYLERYERTMKDKAGQEYWLRPTATSR